MRTLLSQFCESFEEVVRPLLDPLQQSAEALLQAELETMRALRQIAGEERWPAMRDGDRFIGN